MTSRAFPSYSELPPVGPDDEHSSWQLFGPDDEFGCLNFITPEKVVMAAREVDIGQVVNLNLPIGVPQAQFWTSRTPAVHHHEVRGNIRDDSVDSFQMQGSTQWDGFRHQRYREFGYYGGRQESDLDDKGQIGIQSWAQRGIVSRGVLADVAGYLEYQGTPLAPDRRMPIGATLIERTLLEQGTKLAAGDILLVRTGWLEWYLGLDNEVRETLSTELNADRSKVQLPGIDPSRATAGWLWDNQIAAVAVDNPTFETLPYRKEEGWAHNRLLPLLGMPIGELWKLDDLATTCARLSRYTFLLSAPPLNLRGAAGSPANAYAVF